MKLKNPDIGYRCICNDAEVMGIVGERKFEPKHKYRDGILIGLSCLFGLSLTYIEKIKGQFFNWVGAYDIDFVDDTHILFYVEEPGVGRNRVEIHG